MNNTGTMSFKQWACKVEITTYPHNKQIAIVLTGVADGLPIAKATSCVDHVFEEGETAIKDYSENEGMLRALIDAGIVMDTGKRYASGFVNFPIVKLINEIEFANAYGYSDIHPFEIVEKRTSKKLMIRRVKADRDPNWKPNIHVGGFSGNCDNQHSQRWFYSLLPDSVPFAIRQHNDGQWKDKHGQRYCIEDRPIEFYDYNF